jgi:hypothetical protein
MEVEKVAAAATEEALVQNQINHTKSQKKLKIIKCLGQKLQNRNLIVLQMKLSL